MNRILPLVEEITAHHTDRTGLHASSRRAPPDNIELLETIPALRRYSPPARIIDKHVYSPFVEPGLLGVLRENQSRLW